MKTWWQSNTPLYVIPENLPLKYNISFDLTRLIYPFAECCAESRFEKALRSIIEIKGRVSFKSKIAGFLEQISLKYNSKQLLRAVSL